MNTYGRRNLRGRVSREDSLMRTILMWKNGDAGLAGAKTENSIRRGISVVKNIIFICLLIRMSCGNLFERKKRQTQDPPSHFENGAPCALLLAEASRRIAARDCDQCRENPEDLAPPPAFLRSGSSTPSASGPVGDENENEGFDRKKNEPFPKRRRMKFW